MTITHVETGLYRIELPVPLSDSTHGIMTHFELVTVRLRDSDGAEGIGYTYTTGAGLEVHGFGLDRYIKTPMPIIEGKAIASNTPGHGVAFDWEALDKTRA